MPSLVEVAASQRLTVRHMLKTSKNQDINQLWRETSHQNVTTDVHLNTNQNLKAAKRNAK